MLRISRRLLILLAVLASVPAVFARAQVASQATAWTIDPTHSGIEFQIRHLGVANVRGSFSKVTGTVQMDEKEIVRSSVQASIDTATVNTNDGKRDEHLRSADFFDVQKYPAMTFKSTRLMQTNGKLQMVGDLTLGGQTRTLTLDLDGPAAPQKGPGGKSISGFSATGMISRKDFNFGQKYGAPVLGDEVKFTIDIEMSKP